MKSSSTVVVTLYYEEKDKYRSQVLQRVEAMLVALLCEAGIEKSAFKFCIDDFCNSLDNRSRPCVEVSAFSQFPLMVLVRLKTGGAPKSTVKGRLSIPAAMDRAKLLMDMKLGIENFDKEGWQSVFNDIEPLPYPERTTPKQIILSSSPPPTVVAITKGNVEKDIPDVPVGITALATEGSWKANDTKVPHKSGDSDASCVQFLIRILEGKANGIFSGKGMSLISRKFFPDETERYITTGLINTLLGKSYIRRVSSGEYQVEQSFITSHKLDIKGFVQRPAITTRYCHYDCRSS